MNIQQNCQKINQNTENEQKENKSYFLGIDLGTSFIKIALIDQNDKLIELVKTPQTQMKIYSQKQLYCEQDPQEWWKYVCQGIKNIYLKNKQIFIQNKIKGIGISYQMHGLILVDQNYNVLRKSIIWSDGRTHIIGEKIKEIVIENGLQSNLLNYPGNFTISKIKWIQQNQPQIYKKIYKILLPGDFIALKLSSQCTTTQTGLSQCILWDFKQNKICQELLKLTNIQKTLIPQVHSSFAFQGEVSEKGSQQSFIFKGTPILYRSGDQPNNAYTLNVTQIGQIAASGGTSGTVLLVSKSSQSLQLSRINTFLHVNHSIQNPKYGKLLCINSCGIIYSWLKNNFLPENISYAEMNRLAQNCNSSEGLFIIPFGNGLQRMLNHKNTKVSFNGIDLNRHNLKHILRAALQSIAFSFIYGILILKKSQFPQVSVKKIKVTNDNLFCSKLVREIIQCQLGCKMEIIEGTTGAIGSAKGAKQTWLKILSTKTSQQQKQQLKSIKINNNNIQNKQLNSNQYNNEIKDNNQVQEDQNLKNKYQQYSKLYKKWQQLLLKHLNSIQ